MTVADPTQSEIEVVQVGAGGGSRQQPDEQWMGTGV
jgi:hypothetical protein